jgi:hypothetical protein
MDKKVLIYLGIAFVVYQAIIVKMQEKEEQKKYEESIEVPQEVMDNDLYDDPDINVPDDFYQTTNQGDRDYINIFNNKITPLNYMYRSNDDTDKKNVYGNQYIFHKYLNVEGIGSRNEEDQIYALDEFEQDNFSYIPKFQALVYNEEL